MQYFHLPLCVADFWCVGICIGKNIHTLYIVCLCQFLQNFATLHFDKEDKTIKDNQRSEYERKNIQCTTTSFFVYKISILNSQLLEARLRLTPIFIPICHLSYILIYIFGINETVSGRYDSSQIIFRNIRRFRQRYDIFPQSRWGHVDYPYP